MIQIRVAQLNGQRLAKLRRELGDMTAADFFRSVATSDEVAETLEYMEEVSPPIGQPSETKLWLAEQGIRPLGVPFSKGWRIKRVSQGSRIEWRISNVLERSAEGRAKFRSIEFGSRTTQWTASRDFSFKSGGSWYSIDAGSVMIHWGNQPANVLGKTTDFIERVIRQRLADKVTDRVRKKLA